MITMEDVAKMGGLTSPKLEDEPSNFRANGLTFLVRCPDCGRENYGPAVAAGQCAWCGWREES